MDSQSDPPAQRRESVVKDVFLAKAQGDRPQRSQSDIKGCQPLVHGTAVHESWPSNNQSGLPVVESKVFVSRLKNRYVSGHFTVVLDPLRTVSVLEPGGPGGCGLHKMVSVEETARAAGCLYAQNGGFFNTKTGQCLGNVVSDGRLAKDSGGVQNAQFGIRRDGTLVFGYVSKEDVLEQSNPFVQLISGVVWLIKNGSVNIEPSLKAECDKTQETGTLKHFADVISARTAVGHDAQGRLILFHLDGQTGERGMSLWEMADFLKKNGVINAINLDGGGSSTFISNGSLASYPSDECSKPDNSWRCARRVSTVLCVHPHRCQPSDCGGHGRCVAGLCHCQEGWRGAACDFPTCPPSCGAHGVCSASGCVCDAGWRGQNCSQKCPSGFYGDGCNQTCSCMNGASCHHIFGNCSCPPGFSGTTCEEDCPFGFYGDGCKQICPCMNGASCHHIFGNCSCPPGFSGTTCEEDCPSGFYGDGCNQTCSCMNGASCHHIFGNCSCPPGFSGTTCEEDGRSLVETSLKLWAGAYFTESTWLTITAILSSVLLLSLLAHVLPLCRHWLATHWRRDYTYLPLTTDAEVSLQSVIGESGKGFADNSDFLELTPRVESAGEKT
ncbi:N-acetylglucosamine-1-phosphodiester alpha-N-acetylglucosaminidase isoform X2 [Dunckerocampus dactyliophorus]|uniref:N-acetylglucosamine-1-phosphodiester alpha-N-acetylglucosaminidase isoform X2 n=1 Tax=Dunckerocampus dactyliophorus TaxID=161453 RepID=UPI002405C318|nr:N-acetylglucosamine-1-phosphodiester alpha-N-acetylglucosaminidase isoform X2 [Dunckerocampus dactyliophorus]